MLSWKFLITWPQFAVVFSLHFFGFGSTWHGTPRWAEGAVLVKELDSGHLWLLFLSCFSVKFSGSSPSPVIYTSKKNAMMCYAFTRERYGKPSWMIPLWGVGLPYPPALGVLTFLLSSVLNNLTATWPGVPSTVRLKTADHFTKGSLWLATWVSLYEVKGGAAALVCDLPKLYLPPKKMVEGGI